MTDRAVVNLTSLEVSVVGDAAATLRDVSVVVREAVESAVCSLQLELAERLGDVAELEIVLESRRVVPGVSRSFATVEEADAWLEAEARRRGVTRRGTA